MNETKLAIAQLVVLSHNFMNTQLDFVPQKFQMTQYEHEVVPGLIGKLTSVGIERVQARWQVGCVRSYMADPYRRPDPVVVICADMDLVDYYHMWHVLQFADSWHVRDIVVEYDAAIKKAIRSARNLSEVEIKFAICEMLHFRNQMLGRAR